MRSLRARLFLLVAAIVVLAAAGGWFVFARLARTDVERFLAGEADARARALVPGLEQALDAGGPAALDRALERIAATTGAVPLLVTADGVPHLPPSLDARGLVARGRTDGTLVVEWEIVRDGRVHATALMLRGGAPIRAGDGTTGRLHLLQAAAVRGGPAAEPALGGPAARFAGTLARTAALALAVATIVALVAAAALGRRITGPIEALTHAVRTFDAGDLDARVGVRGEDEIATLAAAFNRMAARRGEAERARRALVADVAHELRTPLTNLVAQIEALEDGLARPDAAALASLHEEVDALTHLVDELAELAVADAGGLRLEPTVLDVAAEAETVRSALEPRAHAAGVTIVLDVPADTAAHADARRLRQVLSNLVANAIAHTPPGGRVDLAARPAGDGRTVEIRVEDTGEGIPPAHRARVFDRFHRVDPSRSRATGGRGLGLAIVRQYVEAMGGAVEAAEAAAGGASLRVRLPASPPGGWEGPGRA